MGMEAVRDQLDWANHHLNLLDLVVSAHIDLKNIEFRPERYDDAKTKAWGRLSAKKDSTKAISHVFGDFLQSASSCLDYLVCELFWRYNPGKPAKTSHKFPIVANHTAFNKEIGNEALFGIPFEVIAIIESLQPYEGRTDAVHSNLNTLRALTNKHKHRKIHVSALTANPAPSNVVPVIEDGIGYVRIGDLPSALHFEAKIGPFPIMENGCVDVEGKFTPMVVLEESEFRGVLITLLAARLCEAVTEACNRFDQFFV
jgi:hypothetical protein